MNNISFYQYLNSNVIHYNGDNIKKLSLPLTLQLELTSICNMKCPFCYNSSGISMQNAYDLKIDQWKSVLNSVVDKGGIFQCIISGGEPLLLGPKLFDLMDIVDKDGTGFILITNGSLLNNDIAESLIKYKWFWIQVSIDSHIASKHDKIRGYAGGWEKAVNAIHLLNKYKLPAVIASVISKYNIDDMEGLIQFAIQQKADKIIFTEIIYSGQACNEKELMFNPSDSYHFNCILSKLKQQYADKIMIDKATSYNEQLDIAMQYAPLSLIIRPNGDVKLDCVLPYVLGNVLKTPIEVIWEKVYSLYKSNIIKEYIQNALSDRESVIKNNVGSDIYI